VPHQNLGTNSVYKKALELCVMSREIASYVSLNKDLLKLYQSNSLRDIIANSLLTDAILIPQKIAQTEYTKCKTERLKNALHINIMLRNMTSYCTGLEKDGLKEKEYINLLRKEVFIFKESFKSWKKALK